MQELKEGKQAYKCGQSLEENPYNADTQEAINWVLGWLAQDDLENKEYIGLGSSNTLHY